jgi:TetR/AcrR family transcriptional repressor of nem operon
MMCIILYEKMTDIIQLIMRGSREDKAASHERIVAIAATRIREAGTEQPGVAEIMKAAGLTHGGFYKHFTSRDDLIAEAVQRAMVDSGPRIAALVAEAGTDDLLAAFVDAYLSEDHRDDPGSGCGVAALGTDVARLGASPRDAFRAQVDHYRDQLQPLFGSDDDEARRRATATLCTMVGALIIARGLGPTPQSDALLRDVREALRG